MKEILSRNPWQIEARNRTGMTPFHVAACEADEKMLALLMEHGADTKATWDFFKSGDAGWNALHVAAMAGRSDLIASLVSYGVDLNHKSLSGETPLRVARRNEYKDTAEMIRTLGGK